MFCLTSVVGAGPLRLIIRHSRVGSSNQETHLTPLISSIGLTVTTTLRSSGCSNYLS